jgi:hypothetical protein
MYAINPPFVDAAMPHYLNKQKAGSQYATMISIVFVGPIISLMSL